MKGITTHILDVARGLPAPGVAVELEKREDGQWIVLSKTLTDSDGRARLLNGAPAPGDYRLTFAIAPYFALQGTKAFYPFVQIVFTVGDSRHYHVPLLTSAHSYSTYRGS